MSAWPRLSFGMIVLNGEPFLRYNLRALYPFAHQILVVEGAVQTAAAIATPTGHSIDGTLEALERFKEEEDPHDKVEIIRRDGFWDEKDEQSQAYAERVTGDYLWQVDVDEFYQPHDMAYVCDLLSHQPDITAISFPQLMFWARPHYRVYGWLVRRDGAEIHRLFKWGPGYRYERHRPPTVLDARGHSVREGKWIRARQMRRAGIYMYHYSFLFPRQVVLKSDYYSRAPWARRSRAQEWARNAYLSLQRPYQVHYVYHYPSWLQRISVPPPPQIEALFADIASGRLDVTLRPIADIEQLLDSCWYQAGIAFLKIIEPLAHVVILVRRALLKRLGRL